MIALDLTRTPRVIRALQVWREFDYGRPIDPGWAALASKVLRHAAAGLLEYADGPDCAPGEGVGGTTEEFHSLGLWLRYKADQLSGNRPRQLVPGAKKPPRPDWALPDLVGVWPPIVGPKMVLPPWADARVRFVTGGMSTFSDRNASDEDFDARAKNKKMPWG